jgi:AraC-like DNA-binding protein
METLFVFDKRNYLDCQNTYRGPRNREYYSGDYTIEAGSVIHVRADRKTVGACSIIRLRSKTRLFFRRNWTHIREDATDVAVLWFVKRGRLVASVPGGESVANAGDFMITRSMTPFSVECQPGENSVHEVLHVIVPTHLLRQVLPMDVRPGFCIPADGRKFAIAQRILTDIFEDPGELKEEVSQLLMSTALSVVGDAVKEHQSCSTQRQSMSDKRLHDVLRFIEIHLSDPKLSIATTAKACGISPRYLSLLLKQRGTPFSELVWDKRLKTAGQWLANSKPGEASISEIAYRVGFKSAAHFSRMFKREFKVSPREYRTVGMPRTVEPQTLMVDGGESRH